MAPQNEIRAKPVPRPGLWALTVVAVLVAAFLVWTFASSPNVHWDVIANYQFADAILQGLLVTLKLAVICEITGLLLGIGLAVMRLSSSRVLSWLSGIYVWVFRSVPLLVQLVLWFNLGLLFPNIGIPGTSFVVETNDVITGFVAALLGLTLHEAAYNAEIVRGGIAAVDRGQVEAAQALGMNRALLLRRVVLPQALRVIVPPAGNQFISLLKNTSLVAFIAGGDLLSTAQNIYSGNFEIIALLIVASLWYLLLVSITSFLQGRLERHIGRSSAQSSKPRRDEPAPAAVAGA